MMEIEDNPKLTSCPDCELPGDYALRIAFQEKFDDIHRSFKELDEWRDLCIRRGIITGTVVLLLYLAWLTWMVS